LPPLAWALDRRLIEARRRLRGAESLAAIALDLGFADQAHFTRAFRKVSGLTPGAYRKRASTVC
jgi:AraC family chemosensory pili system transcriptional regulator ChpD